MIAKKDRFQISIIAKKMHLFVCEIIKYFLHHLYRYYFRHCFRFRFRYRSSECFIDSNIDVELKIES